MTCIAESTTWFLRSHGTVTGGGFGDHGLHPTPFHSHVSVQDAE